MNWIRLAENFRKAFSFNYSKKEMFRDFVFNSFREKTWYFWLKEKPYLLQFLYHFFKVKKWFFTSNISSKLLPRKNNFFHPFFFLPYLKLAFYLLFYVTFSELYLNVDYIHIYIFIYIYLKRVPVFVNAKLFL